MSKRLLKYLRNLGIAALTLYIIICGLLYFAQDNLLFHPQPKSRVEITKIIKVNPEFDTLGYTMHDGTYIGGYISTDTNSAKLPVVIYFGGNAEEVSHLMEYKKYFKNTMLALVNYRGFGLSKGSPSEKTMFSDALEVYDKLAKLPNVNAGHIIVIGRSIGTGVATYLSSQRNTKATVLITPYESMIDVAQEKYAFVPIRYLMKHPFESNIYAKTISTPMLALIASNDNVIPKQHAYNLIKSWKGKTTFLEVRADHNSIMNDEKVWQQISECCMVP